MLAHFFRWLLVSKILLTAAPITPGKFLIKQDASSSPYQILSLLISDQILLDQITNHGCHCAKFSSNNPSINLGILGGYEVIDDLDHICKSWIQARKCLDKFEYGSCLKYQNNNFDFNYEVIISNNTNLNTIELACDLMNPNGKSHGSGGDCEVDSCLVDILYATEILDFLENFEDFSTSFNATIVGDGSQCPRDYRQEKVEKYCDGQAPNVKIVPLVGSGDAKVDESDPFSGVLLEMDKTTAVSTTTEPTTSVVTTSTTTTIKTTTEEPTTTSTTTTPTTTTTKSKTNTPLTATSTTTTSTEPTTEEPTTTTSTTTTAEPTTTTTLTTTSTTTTTAEPTTTTTSTTTSTSTTTTSTTTTTLKQTTIPLGAQALPCDTGFIKLNDQCQPINQKNVQLLCSSATVDLTIVMDGSGSIGEDSFEQGMDFLDQLISQLSISETTTRVTVLQFSHNVEMYGVPLESNRTRVQQNLDQMRNSYMKGYTFTHMGIYYGWYASQTHGRENVQQVVVTITDGASTYGLYLDPYYQEPVPDGHVGSYYAPNLFHNYGIVSFAVGVGSGVNQNELNEIASDPDEDYVITIEDYSKMLEYLWQVTGVICQSAGGRSESGSSLISNEDDDGLNNAANRVSYFKTIEDRQLDEEFQIYLNNNTLGYPRLEDRVLDGGERIKVFPSIINSYSNLPDEMI